MEEIYCTIFHLPFPLWSGFNIATVDFHKPVDSSLGQAVNNQLAYLGNRDLEFAGIKQSDYKRFIDACDFWAAKRTMAPILKPSTDKGSYR